MIQNKRDLSYYLQEDAISLGKRSRTLKKRLVEVIFPDYIYKFQRTLRYLEYYSNCKVPFGKIFWLYYKIKFRKLSLKLNFSIPINVFDAGLAIAHYGTIVVNPNARVGKNCRIHACVNIGASGGSSKAPQIGNNVYIGPGALIFGNINVADNITIGANATVNKTVNEHNVVLAGVPANIVKRDYPNWTEFNKR